MFNVSPCTSLVDKDSENKPNPVTHNVTEAQVQATIASPSTDFNCMENIGFSYKSSSIHIDISNINAKFFSKLLKELFKL